MTSYLKRMPSGFAGFATRPLLSDIQSAVFNPNFVSTSFGSPVKMVNGKLESIQAGDSASDFYGVLVRLAPSILGSLDQSFANETPNVDAIQGVVVKGYINVYCNLGTPVRNSPVYMRILDNGPNLVGDFEATFVNGENVLLEGVTWEVNGLDATNISELRIA